jgi:3',5'-cyclic AMP phosphodiesterase CpdA
MPNAVTLAHLSDVHLSPLTGFGPRYWNAKRALGFVNWQRQRRFVHRREIADRIIADVQAQAPDHIAVTGDLVNIGLPAEYIGAARWLAGVGAPGRVSVVPGNHDIYSSLGRDPGVGRWQPHMASDAWGAPHAGDAAAAFPYVRRVGPIALIGLCSAVETPPGVATGRLGQAQLAATRRLLERLAGEPVFRLVMIHHPPLPDQTRPSHALTDAAELAGVLTAAGAELVLHGHTHLPTAIELPRAGTPAGRPVPVVGVASASAALRRGAEPLAQYNLLRITGGPGQWQIDLRRRGLTEPDGAIGEIERRTIG